MKKILYVVVALLSLSIHTAFGADPASVNIRINVSGAAADNSDFVCLPNIGCLSAKAGEKGKEFPVFRTVHMTGIYVTNVDKGFRVTDNDMPASCKKVVNPGQTITINGKITSAPNQNTMISGLNCTVTG